MKRRRTDPETENFTKRYNVGAFAVVISKGRLLGSRQSSKQIDVHLVPSVTNL